MSAPIENDRNLIAVINSRIKHGGAGTVLAGDARWAYTDAVERLLSDHARLRTIAGEAENAEVLAAAFELLDAQAEQTGSKRYTAAWGQLRRAVRNARA